MKLRYALPALLTVAGACLLYAKTTSDYDHTVNFERYHTYSIIKVHAEDSLWDDRISTAINTQLTAKGWQNVPSGGDASVAAYGNTHTERDVETWYAGGVAAGDGGAAGAARDTPLWNGFRLEP